MKGHWMTLHTDIGDKVTVSKTVGEVDVTLFAGVSGDHYAAHTDHEFMKQSTYGQRIAHGALLVGYMSAASRA
jgi:3-hydroxybutyryl-CoA dehydratase